MVYGPCDLTNKSSLEGKCSKYYPKKFQSYTIVDQDGYPIYKRIDNGHTIEKIGIILNNVGSNRVSVQSTWNGAIKALPLNKGSNRVLVVNVGSNRVSMQSKYFH